MQQKPKPKTAADFERDLFDVFTPTIQTQDALQVI